MRLSPMVFVMLLRGTLVPWSTTAASTSCMPTCAHGALTLTRALQAFQPAAGFEGVESMAMRTACMRLGGRQASRRYISRLKRVGPPSFAQTQSHHRTIPASKRGSYAAHVGEKTRCRAITMCGPLAAPSTPLAGSTSPSTVLPDSLPSSAAAALAAAVFWCAALQPAGALTQLYAATTGLPSPAVMALSAAALHCAASYRQGLTAAATPGVAPTPSCTVTPEECMRRNPDLPRTAGRPAPPPR